MKFFGIDFVPINEPLESRLQALAAGAWFCSCVFIGHFCLVALVYLLFTRFWWLSLAYLCWIYLDRHTCERGGRPSTWIQNWAWWRYMKNYFSARLKLVPNFTLDPNRNYLFCCFPHGVLPAGPYNSIASEASDFHQIHKHFKVKTTSLSQLYYLPITRELGLALGGISCSVKSLEYILTRPEGGYIANLIPGGAAEATYAKPGKYTFVVKNRKGFIKVALRTGAPLVPVITFGETDLFDQFQSPMIMRIQEFFRKYFGFAPVLFIGRGFLQYSFGAIPRKTALTTVVGLPIEVTKVEDPTEDQINQLHRKFVEELTNLFDKYKYECLVNPEDTNLELK